MEQLNDSFFENINTEIQAYLLGFYLGDGSMTKQNRFTISVSEIDSYIIKLCIKYIDNRKKLRIYNSKRENEKPYAKFAVMNKTLCYPIIRIGWGNRKTYIKKYLPNFIKNNKEIFRHFLRGYFDADGSATWSNVIRKNGKITTLRCFSISSKDNCILEDIKIELEKYNIFCRVRFMKNKGYTLSTYSMKEMDKILNFLYIDSQFYLKRKLKKLKECLLPTDKLRKL